MEVRMKILKILAVFAFLFLPSHLSFGESESIDNNGDIVSQGNDDDPMPTSSYGSSKSESSTDAYNEEYDLPPDPEESDEPEQEDPAPPSGGI